MKPSVRDIFPSFTAMFEGTTTWMYLDIRGLVTTGRGNLIDPASLACSLPWKHLDGAVATEQAIREAWAIVKARGDLKLRGGSLFAPLTSLRLSMDDVDHMTMHKLDANAGYLAKRFPYAEEWPADAQLGLYSMAWAAGPALVAPRFEAACKAMDFRAAAIECHLADIANPGLVPRNLANRILFLNAEAVCEQDMDRDQLHYPEDISLTFEDTKPDRQMPAI